MFILCHSQKTFGLKQMNRLFLLALVLTVLTACTTQKKRSEQSGLSKLWHNTTAHYNGYFNAAEIIDETVLGLTQAHEDNYLQLLEVYPYTTTDNPKAIAPRVDEAIKKVTIVINLHPYSQWSDDCYLLAGQGLYLKQDYESAEKAFRFLIREYPPEDEADEKAKAKAKKKGKKGKASSSKSGGKSTSSGALEGEKTMTAAQRAKARKKYNREVAKRKKQRAKDKKKGKSAPAATKKTDEPATATPAAPKAPETPAPVEEPVRTGLVRLSQDPAAQQVDGDPESYLLRHRPAFQEGQLWLARTLVKRDNYDAARRILSQLEQSPATFNDVRAEAAVAMASLNIREKNYAQAVQSLERAINQADDKEEKARYAFIQGQLNQQLGNSQGAYASYQQVIKARPEYPMEFAARLKMAQNGYLSKQETAAGAIAKLEQLLQDEKNKVYEDQIYYAMATIMFAEGDNAEGVAYLQKSLSSPSSSRAQRTEAYYQLGSMFYEQQEYLSAKLYFDSTLNVMTSVDERFKPTERLRNSLSDIAQNLEIIALQDSLLRVAEMSPEDQAALAKKINEQRNKPTASPTEPGRDKFNPGGTARAPIAGAAGQPGAGVVSAINTPSSFFAYDDKAIKRGEREFSRRWGTRPLEDNWRRSSRTDVGFVEEEKREETSVNLLTQDQIDKILADVPSTDAEKEAVRLKIKKSMFELGRLYRDRLENNQKCVEILEELNTRFPGNIHELDSWYYLYLAYTDLGNNAKARAYRDKILQKYPSSTFGQILQNPNYAQEFLDTERQQNRSYDGVYQLFEQGRYEEVIRQSQVEVGRLPGKHVLKPRYALLVAMSNGNIQGKEAYVAELQKVIGSYPNTPEEVRAKEILRLLGAAGASLPGQTQEAAAGAFTVNDSDLHYVIIVFDSDKVDLNAAKIKVSDYNEAYHGLDKLRISNVYLGDGNNIPVLVLRRFKDKTAAMEYYTGVQKNGKDFIDPNAMNFQLFPVTQTNYREVLRNRSVEGYKTFFEANYK